MRKNYKRKRRSCALCKPNKMGWESRWTAKEAARQKAMEEECRRLTCQDRRDLIDARLALAEMKCAGAKSLSAILKDLNI